jgi:hypothetical protein
MPLTACAKIIKYVPATCAPASGGIARIGIADATLLDFTQAAPVSGVPQPYTAVTDLGTSTKIYGVQFTRQKARYTYDQKNTDGVNPSYTHKLTFDVPNINMLSMQWNSLVDIQGYCCGVLIFIFMNAGPILIMGEASVNGSPLTIPFYTYQDGGKGDSGQKFDDPNSNTQLLTGMYNRPLVEYTGTAASLLGLFA